MKTVGRRIIESVKDLLLQPQKPDGLNVHLDPARPIDKDRLPAVAVSRAQIKLRNAPGETVSPLELEDVVERRLYLSIEIRVGGADVDALITQEDDIYAWVVTQLMLDPEFGGLALGISEIEQSFDTAQLDITYRMIAVVFEVLYVTAESDPRKQSPDEVLPYE